MSDDDPIIKPIKNGPFQVKNLTDLKRENGETIGTKPLMILCRCGGSSNKPFCDNTHSKIGFTDEKEADREPDRMDNYQGRVLTIHDNRGVCAHRGYCTDNAPKVFLMDTEPWVDPDGMEPDEACAVIDTCPSGALSFTRDGVLHKDHDRKPEIIVMNNGPYDVVGGPEFIDPDGDKPESKEHYTLCRCGKSKNMPFCNGQHWNVEFKDP
jgi:CDGSH-type Zn-finger protein